MTKLMIVIHSLRFGGSERVVVNLLKGLSREDFAITLVLYEPVFDLPVPDDVAVEILNIGSSRNFFRMSGGFLAKIVALAKLLRSKKPDVVLGVLSSTNVAVLLAKALSRTPARVIASEHTFPSVILRSEGYGGITKLFMKYTYPWADRIIAVSQEIRNDLVSNWNLPAEKITVIHIALDLQEIEALARKQTDHPWFREDIPIVVAVGRLTKQKGYRDLLKAFVRVRQKFLCRLVLIGEGEDRAGLAALVQELRLENDVAFLGYQENPFRYMARSSVFVLSSLYEGFPNVIGEAMALGLPVVSTDCPSGPSEIITEGENGLLVPVGDEQALAEAIGKVLADRELAARLSRGGRTRAADLALQKIAEQYRSVFLENSPSAL